MAFQLKSTLTTTNKNFYAAAIDIVNGFAYFGSGSSITKVRLSDFTQVSVLPVSDDVSTLSIDTVNNLLYYGGQGVAKKIGKVRLDNFTEVTTIAGSFAQVSSSIDVASGFVYFGEFSGRVEKVSLATFSIVATLNTAVNTELLSSAIDLTNGFIYFGGQNGTYIKVKISTFSVDSTAAGSSETHGIVLDINNDFGYFSGYASRNVNKVKLSTFSVVDSVSYPPNKLYNGVGDIPNRFAYFGTADAGSNGEIVQIDLETFTVSNTVNTTTWDVNGFAAAIDQANGFAYFGSYWFKKIYKIELDQRPSAPVANILGRPPHRSTGTSVSSIITCGRKKQR